MEAIVHWIKLAAGTATVGLSLIGCASQDTILPTQDQNMLNIYREALADTPGTSVISNSEAICTDLDLDETLEQCEETLEAHAKARYSVIDSSSEPQKLSYISYTREQKTEIENLFPRLANPDLVIYVYPHLATRVRAPIPGYSTVIPLYERVEYRMPGENLAETPQSGFRGKRFTVKPSAAKSEAAH